MDSSPNWEFDPPFVRDVSQRRKHVIIELGSGSGIVGSHIAKTLEPGRDLVIVTDLPEVGIDNLRCYGHGWDVLKFDSNRFVLCWRKTSEARSSIPETLNVHLMV